MTFISLFFQHSTIVHGGYCDHGWGCFVFIHPSTWSGREKDIFCAVCARATGGNWNGCEIGNSLRNCHSVLKLNWLEGEWIESWKLIDCVACLSISNLNFSFIIISIQMSCVWGVHRAKFVDESTFWISECRSIWISWLFCNEDCIKNWS